MRKEIKVTIPEPCHEDWNQMTPQEKGRHCKVCDKTVVDFTDKTDEYIVKTFEKEGKLCGRFKGQQLDRPLAYSRKESTNYLAVAATSALAFLTFGTQSAKAQGNSQIKTEVVKPNQVKGKIAHSVLKNKVVSGRVIGKNNLPLVNVQVSEKGTNNLTVTDKNGNYTIKVNNDSYLLFIKENYQDFEILVESSNSISIEMVESKFSTTKNGKLIITGIITDDNGLPLPSATVIEKGTENGTSTDFDGYYTLEVETNTTITASYIGYETKDVKINNSNKTKNISLELDTTSCDSYIVAGFVETNYVSDCEKNKRKTERKASRILKRQEKKAKRAK